MSANLPWTYPSDGNYVNGKVWIRANYVLILVDVTHVTFTQVATYCSEFGTRFDSIMTALRDQWPEHMKVVDDGYDYDDDDDNDEAMMTTQTRRRRRRRNETTATHRRSNDDATTTQHRRRRYTGQDDDDATTTIHRPRR